MCLRPYVAALTKADSHCTTSIDAWVAAAEAAAAAAIAAEATITAATIARAQCWGRCAAVEPCADATSAVAVYLDRAEQHTYSPGCYLLTQPCLALSGWPDQFATQPHGFSSFFEDDALPMRLGVSGTRKDWRHFDAYRSNRILAGIWCHWRLAAVAIGQALRRAARHARGVWHSRLFRVWRSVTTTSRSAAQHGVAEFQRKRTQRFVHQSMQRVRLAALLHRRQVLKLYQSAHAFVALWRLSVALSHLRRKRFVREAYACCSIVFAAFVTSTFQSRTLRTRRAETRKAMSRDVFYLLRSWSQISRTLQRLDAIHKAALMRGSFSMLRTRAVLLRNLTRFTRRVEIERLRTAFTSFRIRRQLARTLRYVLTRRHLRLLRVAFKEFRMTLHEKTLIHRRRRVLLWTPFQSLRTWVRRSIQVWQSVRYAEASQVRRRLQNIFSSWFLHVRKVLKQRNLGAFIASTLAHRKKLSTIRVWHNSFSKVMAASTMLRNRYRRLLHTVLQVMQNSAHNSLQLRQRSQRAIESRLLRHVHIVLSSWHLQVSKILVGRGAGASLARMLAQRRKQRTLSLWHSSFAQVLAINMLLCERCGRILRIVFDALHIAAQRTMKRHQTIQLAHASRLLKNAHEMLCSWHLHTKRALARRAAGRSVSGRLGKHRKRRTMSRWYNCFTKAMAVNMMLRSRRERVLRASFQFIHILAQRTSKVHQAAQDVIESRPLRQLNILLCSWHFHTQKVDGQRSTGIFVRSVLEQRRKQHIITRWYNSFAKALAVSKLLHNQRGKVLRTAFEAMHILAERERKLRAIQHATTSCLLTNAHALLCSWHLHTKKALARRVAHSSVASMVKHCWKQRIIRRWYNSFAKAMAVNMMFRNWRRQVLLATFHAIQMWTQQAKQLHQAVLHFTVSRPLRQMYALLCSWHFHWQKVHGQRSTGTFVRSVLEQRRKQHSINLWYGSFQKALAINVLIRNRRGRMLRAALEAMHTSAKRAISLHQTVQHVTASKLLRNGHVLLDAWHLYTKKVLARRAMGTSVTGILEQSRKKHVIKNWYSSFAKAMVVNMMLRNRQGRVLRATFQAVYASAQKTSKISMLVRNRYGKILRTAFEAFHTSTQRALKLHETIQIAAASRLFKDAHTVFSSWHLHTKKKVASRGASTRVTGMMKQRTKRRTIARWYISLTQAARIRPLLHCSFRWWRFIVVARQAELEWQIDALRAWGIGASHCRRVRDETLKGHKVDEITEAFAMRRLLRMTLHGFAAWSSRAMNVSALRHFLRTTHETNLKQDAIRALKEAVALTRFASLESLLNSRAALNALHLWRLQSKACTVALAKRMRIRQVAWSALRITSQQYHACKRLSQSLTRCLCSRAIDSLSCYVRWLAEAKQSLRQHVVVTRRAKTLLALQAFAYSAARRERLPGVLQAWRQVCRESRFIRRHELAQGLRTWRTYCRDRKTLQRHAVVAELLANRRRLLAAWLPWQLLCFAETPSHDLLIERWSDAVAAPRILRPLVVLHAANTLSGSATSETKRQ